MPNKKITKENGKQATRHQNAYKYRHLQIRYWKQASRNMNNNDFTEIFEMKDQEIIKLLERRVVKLEQQIDENSAHERKNSLIMAGTTPAAQNAEDCKFIVRDQIREHLRQE